MTADEGVLSLRWDIGAGLSTLREKCPCGSLRKLTPGLCDAQAQAQAQAQARER